MNEVSGRVGSANLQIVIGKPQNSELNSLLQRKVGCLRLFLTAMAQDRLPPK